MIRKAVPFVAGGLGILLVLWLFLFNHVEVHEVGIALDPISGTLSMHDRPGFYLTRPWVMVASVETRPQRVCLTSSGRGVSCRFVRFVPEQYGEFVKVEGFRYYWWSNRLSFNFGYDDEYRGFRDLLRGYAYESAPRPFIENMQQ